MVAGRETFTRGREIFLRGRDVFARGRDVSGLWRETLLERVSATLGATTGATIGATTGVGIIFANLLIISVGVRGVTKRQSCMYTCICARGTLLVCIGLYGLLRTLLQYYGNYG